MTFNLRCAKRESASDQMRSTMISVNKVFSEGVLMNFRLWGWRIAVGASILLGVPAVAAPTAIKISQGVLPQQQENPQAAGETAFNEGFVLYYQGTAESLKQALAKFEEALKLFRQTGDRREEAVTLFSISRVYSGLGDEQKALDYHNQFFSLSQRDGGIFKKSDR